MATLLLMLALSLGDLALRLSCGLMAALSAVGMSQHQDEEQRCGAGASSSSGDSTAHSASSGGHAWKSGSAGSSGSFSSSSSSLPSEVVDVWMWLKLLFLPSLGILVLLAFLLEEWCAATAANNNNNQQQQQQIHTTTANTLNHATGGDTSAAAHPPGGGGGGGGAFGWLRSWCLRAPRLTTAYQAQLQANAAALVLAHTHQHAVVHAHMAHLSSMHHGGNGVCCGGIHCTGGGGGGANGILGGPNQTSNKLHASQSSMHSNSNNSSGGGLDQCDRGGAGNNGNDSHHSSSPFSTAPLNLNLNGFNHLYGASGPLLYYNTFQRELPQAPAVTLAAEPKPNGKGANGAKKANINVKEAVANPSADKPSPVAGAAAAVPSSPKLDATTVVDPASPSSSATAVSAASSSSAGVAAVSSSVPLPPAHEFVPVTLVNASTGFRSTLLLWEGLTFAEILKYYVGTHWVAGGERSKYEAMEGATSNASNASSNAGTTSSEDAERETDAEVIAAVLERTPAVPSASSSSKQSQQQQQQQQSTRHSRQQQQSKQQTKSSSSASSASSASTAAAKSNPQPPLMLRYQGVRISPLLTPAAVFPALPRPTPTTAAATATTAKNESDATGSTAVVPASAASVPTPSASCAAASTLPPPPVLEICVDYLLLFDRFRVSSHGVLATEHARVRSCVEMQGKLVLEVGRTESEIAALVKKGKEAQERQQTLSNEMKKASKEVERVTKEIAALAKTRSELEASMASSVGLISNARMKLEAEYRALRVEHDAKLQEHAAQKAHYQSLLDHRFEASTALKNAMIASETLQKKLNAIKVQKIKREKIAEKIKKMETMMGINSSSSSDNNNATTTTGASSGAASVGQPFNAVLAMKHRYDVLESEHNVLNVSLNELRLKSHEIDDLSKNETYKLRYRLKLLDKDQRDLAKWKALARAHEQEAKESVRWKNALKQTKMREKILEVEAKERIMWKIRARDMENEVKVRTYARTHTHARPPSLPIASFSRLCVCLSLLSGSSRVEGWSGRIRFRWRDSCVRARWRRRFRQFR